MAGLPPGVSETIIRETAVDEVSRALVNTSPDFARIIRAEYARLHRMPPVKNGGSTKELWQALMAFRAKIGVIRHAATSLLQAPEKNEQVLRILSDYCERTGLTAAAQEESLSVMTEISLAIRWDGGSRDQHSHG